MIFQSVIPPFFLQSPHSRPATTMSSPLSGYDSGYGLGRGSQWINTPALSSKPVPVTQHSSVPLSFQPPSAMLEV